MNFRNKQLFPLGDKNADRSASIWLFLIGLGSWTQINIGGYTAISEFFLVLMLPINLIRNQSLFRRDGISTVVKLLLFWAIGVCVTDIYHQNPFEIWVRGMIPPVGILTATVGIYPLLKRNPDGLKWLLLGIFVSSIVSIFIFQAGADVGRENVRAGEISAVEAVVGYKLFWVSRMNQLLTLPIKGWFFQTPHAMSVFLVLGLAVFGLKSGGRSAFAGMALSAILLIIGRKNVAAIRNLKKHMVAMMIVLMMMAVCFKICYKYAVVSGWMGEEELIKYEDQTSGGDSFLRLLMAGRAEFFVAAIAALDSPLIGHGSFAIDDKNYYLNFIREYGSQDEKQQYFEQILENNTGRIPAHSQIAMYWCWHGLPGLLFWLYLGYLLVVTLFKRMDVIPQYFGFLAIVIPSSLWALFFSPLGRRIDTGMLLAVLLLIRIVYLREGTGCKVGQGI